MDDFDIDTLISAIAWDKAVQHYKDDNGGLIWSAYMSGVSDQAGLSNQQRREFASAIYDQAVNGGE
jgi:hypothetical protein